MGPGLATGFPFPREHPRVQFPPGPLKIYAFFTEIPDDFPSSQKAIPFRSRTALIADRVAGIGTRRPASKSRTVEFPTLAALARASCERFNQARAARHCSGAMESR